MKKSVALLLASLAVSSPLAAAAAEVKVDLIQLEPFAMENPDKGSADKYVGIIPEIMKELEKRSGLKIQQQLTPYARVERDLQEGACDFALLNWADQRAAFANKGTEVWPLELGVRALKGIPLKSYEDLRPLSVSVSRGLKVSPQFDADAALKKDLDLDYTTGVKKAGLGRVQAVAGGLGPINYIIRKHNLSDKFGDTLVLSTAHGAVHYSKKSAQPGLEPKVNEVLSGMVKDGTVKRILDKWLGP